MNNKRKSWYATAVFPILPLIIVSQARPAQKVSEPPPAVKDQAAPTHRNAPLTDLTLVSTTEAARTAAQEAAKSKKNSKEKANSDSNAVLEFRPANPKSSAGDKPFVVNTGKPKKGPLKDVHGSLYGATGVSTRATGGDIGATSQNGKTSVYLQSERSRTNNPH